MTILADIGLMRYAAKHHPKLRLHLSVQGSATHYEAINFYREHFGVQRAVLPRVVVLRHRRIVQHRRRMLAGQGGAAGSRRPRGWNRG